MAKLAKRSLFQESLKRELYSQFSRWACCCCSIKIQNTAFLVDDLFFSPALYIVVIISEYTSCSKSKCIWREWTNARTNERTNERYVRKIKYKKDLYCDQAWFLVDVDSFTSDGMSSWVGSTRWCTFFHFHVRNFSVWWQENWISGQRWWVEFWAFSQDVVRAK